MRRIRFARASGDFFNPPGLYPVLQGCIDCRRRFDGRKVGRYDVHRGMSRDFAKADRDDFRSGISSYYYLHPV